jgi:hypothetical protein
VTRRGGLARTSFERPPLTRVLAAAGLIAAGLLPQGVATAGAPAAADASFEPPWSRPPDWARGGDGRYFSPTYERAARAARDGQVAPSVDSFPSPSEARLAAAAGTSPTATPAPAPALAAGERAVTAARRPAGQPLWEVGVVAGAATFPDWPAAGDGDIHPVVLPLLRYRGEVLRSDEKGLLRGRLLRTEEVELDVSLAGSLPTESDSSGPRAGMPDLDWLGEIGPRLQWTLARAAHSASIDLEIPLRAVFSTDFHSHLDHEGVLLDPELAWSHSDFLGSGTAVKLGLGAMFGDEGLNDYLYEVAPAYATAGRPAYDAEAGYMGSTVSLGLARPLTDWVSLLGHLQADLHQGAANDTSPLFQDDVTYSAGLVLAVTFARSKARARDGGS